MRARAAAAPTPTKTPRRSKRCCRASRRRAYVERVTRAKLDAARGAADAPRPAAGARSCAPTPPSRSGRASSASRPTRAMRRACCALLVGPHAPRAHRRGGAATARNAAARVSVSRVRFAPLARAADRRLRRQRRALRQGRRLRDPERGGGLDRAHRGQLLRYHGFAAVRDGAAACARPASERVTKHSSQHRHARHPDQLVAAGDARRRRRERRGAGAARRAHARARPGRQHLPRQGGARAARHAVGLHRHRPGARRLPARGRRLGNGQPARRATAPGAAPPPCRSSGRCSRARR